MATLEELPWGSEWATIQGRGFSICRIQQNRLWLCASKAPFLKVEKNRPTMGQFYEEAERIKQVATVLHYGEWCCFSSSFFNLILRSSSVPSVRAMERRLYIASVENSENVD